MYDPSKHTVVIVFWWFEKEASSLPPDNISHTLMLFPPKKRGYIQVNEKRERLRKFKLSPKELDKRMNIILKIINWALFFMPKVCTGILSVH